MNSNSPTSKTPNADNIYHITLLRHAESIGNAQHLMPGQLDDALSEKGRAQAMALAQRWQNEGVTFDLLIASPLLRARETAEIITAALHIPLEFDSLWVERNMGNSSGMREAEARALYAEGRFTNPYQPLAETGEGDWQLYLRAGQALFDLLRRPAGKYLIVSHGEMLNMAIYAILGITPLPNFQGPRFRFENAAFSKFSYYSSRHHWRVDVLGDQAHWKDDK